MNYVKKFLIGNFGLFLCAVGIYFLIQANIGLAPWDALAIGVSMKTGMLYGDAVLIISVAVLVIDVIVGEKIGIISILNAVIIGKIVDVFNHFDILPMQENFFMGLLVMLIGQVVLSFGCYYYIKPGLGCGPRDSLMVALGKKIDHFPIGVIKGILETSVMIIGWLMGAKIGIGTVLCMFGMSVIMQFVFDIMKFDVKAVKHESVFQTCKYVLNKGE
ncbi:MAG: hypothetical protein RSA49_02820 [Anaerovoracaceae bacterium]